MIEALRPTIQQIADELLDTAQANGRIELIREYAYPLPSIVIATMLGVPPEDRDQFNIWSGHFGTLLDMSNSTLEDIFQAISAVPELLRYDGPVQLTSRRAKEDLYIGDKAIGAGQEVIMLLGAANHDPAQFSTPDQLNLSRPENRHLAFGLGIHFCLGAPLARVEGEIAFSTLVRRFPGLHLETEDVAWQPSIVFRGPKQLPIVLS